MERENGNAEGLLFQLKQLQKEGKSVGGLIKQTEQELWQNSEKKLSPERPRWKIIDKDEGIAFYQKGSKHMDFIEGRDEEEGYTYKDVIIYDANSIGDTLVRHKKESLDKKE